MESTKNYEILKIKGQEKTKEEDLVVVEYPLTLELDGKKIMTLFCSPKSLKELVIGYLYSEGHIESLSDLENIQIDEKKGLAKISLTKGREEILEKKKLNTGMPSTFEEIKDSLKDKRIRKNLPIHEEILMDFMATFTENSDTFTKTGGVHSCGLYDYEGMIFFEDDIGRHNAYDKIFGRALLEGIDPKDKMILTSGRISSEMLVKAAKRQVPMIVSKSAPMSLAIDLANNLNMCLIGFVRGQRMNIYTNIPE